MTSAEFAEMLAYERLEGPLSPEREDWRLAMIASIIANANRDPKKSKRAYEPRDFIPDWAESAGVAKAKLHPAVIAEKVKTGLLGLARKAGK